MDKENSTRSLVQLDMCFQLRLTHTHSHVWIVDYARGAATTKLAQKDSKYMHFNPSGQPDRFFTVISQVPKLQAVDYNETGGHSNGEDCDETFLREISKYRKYNSNCIICD